MSQPHKHRDAIIAWANGESVEYKVGETWYDVLNPAWDEEVQYRVKPKIVKREGWVNVYKTGPSSTWSASTSQAHHTKEDADKYSESNRVACIRIEWEEEV